MNNRKKGVSALALFVLLALTPFFTSAWIGENGWNWDYTWDDPTLYTYCINFSCNGGDGYSNYNYAASYTPNQTYQSYYQSQYQSSFQSYYQQQDYLYPSYGYGQYGYDGGGYQSYGFSSGTPTGDTIPYVNEPICDYPGYGRYSCLYHPAQPLYDYWTGTWY